MYMLSLQNVLFTSPIAFILCQIARLAFVSSRRYVAVYANSFEKMLRLTTIKHPSCSNYLRSMMISTLLFLAWEWEKKPCMILPLLSIPQQMAGIAPGQNFRQGDRWFLG
jgi:hypothetical protein